MTGEEYEFLIKFRTEALSAAKAAQDALDDMGDSADNTAEDVDDYAASVTAATQAIGELIGAGAGFAATFMAISNSVSAFADYEEALIGVAKTSNLVKVATEQLGGQFEIMAFKAGIPVENFTEVAEVAGQLGVQGAGNIAKFTKTIVDLGGASNLVGEEGAQTLARMLSVMQEHIGEADRLASVIVALGNNVAASEREIAGTAQEIALATATFKIGTTEATAMAAAMAELGLRPQLAGTAVGRVFIGMADAASKGGKAVEDFAKATNLTTRQFLDMQKADPAALFYKLLEAMNKMENNDVLATLTDLELGNAETFKSLLPLISGYERLREVRDLALEEATNPDALAEEARRAEEALNRQIQGIQEGLAILNREFGEGIAPIVQEIVDVARAGIEVFIEMEPWIQRSVLAFLALAPAVGASVLALRAVVTIMGLIIPAATGAAGATTALGTAMRFMLGPVGMVLTVLGAASVAFGVLSTSTRKSMSEISGELEQTNTRLTQVREKLADDAERLALAEGRLADAAKDASGVKREAAIADITTINARIEANEHLRDELLISQQVLLAEARRASEDAQAELSNALIAVGLKTIDAQSRLAKEAGEDYATLNKQLYDDMVASLASGDLDGVRSQVNDFMANLSDMDGVPEKLAAEIRTLWLEMHKAGENADEAEGEVVNLEEGVVALGEAGAGAAPGVDVLTNSTGNLGAAASGALVEVSALVKAIPGLAAATAQAASLRQAELAYKQEVADLGPDATTAEQISALTLYQQAVKEITGEAEAVRDAGKALDDYVSDSKVVGLDAKAKAIHREKEAYKELVKQLNEAGASTDDLARAEAAHAANLVALNKRKGSGGGGGSEEETLSQRLAEATLEYRQETDQLTSSMWEGNNARQDAIELQELLNKVQKDGEQVSEAEAEALARLVARRREAITEAGAFGPALARAIGDATDAMIDATDLAASVTGEFTGMWGSAVDDFVDSGFKFDNLADIVGNSFKRMGAEIIKFSLDLLVVRPILDTFKDAMSGIGGTSGGGSGFMSFLGNALVGTFTRNNAKGNVFTSSQTVPLERFAESGAEGLLPLTRMDDGTLGVRSTQGAAQGVSGGMNIGTYAPVYNIDQSGNATQEQSPEQSEAMMRAMDEHMQSALQEFLTKQLMNGGILNPPTKLNG